MVERKFTIFSLFYFVFEGTVFKYKPRGLIRGGAIKWGVFCVMGLRGLYMEGLIFGILRYYDHFEAEEMHILKVPRMTNINLLLTISTYHQGERL